MAWDWGGMGKGASSSNGGDSWQPPQQPPASTNQGGQQKPQDQSTMDLLFKLISMIYGGQNQMPQGNYDITSPSLQQSTQNQQMAQGDSVYNDMANYWMNNQLST